MVNKGIAKQVAHFGACLTNYGWTLTESTAGIVNARRKGVSLHINMNAADTEICMWRKTQVNIVMKGIRRTSLYKNMGKWLVFIDMVAEGLLP